MVPLAADTTSAEDTPYGNGEIVKADSAVPSPSLLATLYSMLDRQGGVIDRLTQQVEAQRVAHEALTGRLQELETSRETADSPASLSPSEGVSELALAKATLLKGFTLNPKRPTSTSPFSDAPSALTFMQRLYPNHPLMEAVAHHHARVDFSSVGTWAHYDSRSGHTLSQPRAVTKAGAWLPLNSSEEQYAQITFDRPVVVVGVATAGRDSTEYQQWVTSYKVEVLDRDTATGSHVWVAAEPGVKQYTGNTDKSTIVLQTFGNPVVAKQVKITPLECQVHPSMRFEVYAWAY
ncbi:hypothetical protein KIPB_006759 [Kipferlia bialata]|uniref:F5/8 type C domain-containing protein n=1 Tax=Kipferlia bialata TaxID=797122 RepID=A0A9K3CZ08_9EUKA|nr:hypothetical protein KIPB_006759 [Kipferlia bialata]|eukprot:g6759.t1